MTRAKTILSTMMRANSCALITGGGKGIGKAIAIQLSNDFNYHIIINYCNNKQNALSVQKEIIDNGGSAEILQFDVKNRNLVETSLEKWRKNNPNKQIDVLINNAGVIKDKLLLWMEEEDWDEVVDTSLKGFYNVTRSVIRTMLLNRFGKIINISSLSGLKGSPGQLNYSAAKAGLIGATKSLAQEVAKRNINVNAVAPGFIESSMTEELGEKYLAHIPMGRFGKPEEVAHLVSFLVSDKANYINGEVINVNGGLYS